MTASPVVGSSPPAAPGWGGELDPLLRWLSEDGPVPELELACGEHGDPRRGSRRPVVVVVPGCVAEISVASYLELAAAGVSRVTVGTRACPPSTRTAAVLAEARQLLHAAGCTSTVEPAPDGRGRSRDVYLLHRLPISRRRLLTLGLAHHEPRAGDGTDRGRAIAALQALRRRAATGQPEPAGASSLAELPAASADLYVSGCTMCGVCARACPADALCLDTALVDGVERHSLRLRVSSCTDCGRCISLCPEQAIIRRGTVPWSVVLDDKEPRVLARADVRHCARCQAVIPVQLPGDLCELCSFRKANPFGSRLIGPLTQKTRP